jgi:hypothetical protein
MNKIITKLFLYTILLIILIVGYSYIFNYFKFNVILGILVYTIIIFFIIKQIIINIKNILKNTI